MKSLKYLFWCAKTEIDFRITEFESLAKIFRIPLKWVEKNSQEPWVILEFEQESQVKQILSRSIATKHCIELWAEGNSWTDLHKNLKNFPEER